MTIESIITRLYKGKIYPEEQLLPQSKEACAARRERGKWEDKLKSTLSKKQARLLEKMQDAEASCATLECEAAFAEGIRFGIQLMRELFPLEKPGWAGKEWPGE